MTDNEKIAIGRRYAIGDGVCVDFEKAYQFWRGVRFQLDGDDSMLFAMIEEILYASYTNKYMETNVFSAVPIVRYAQTVEKQHTEAEVRALFEKIIASAGKTGNYESVYKALAKLEDSKTKERPEKPENKRFGNNIKFLLYQFGWNVAYFCGALNDAFIAAGLKKKTAQAIYQVIGGVNGMNDAGQLKTVELFNEADKKRGLMLRPLTVSDLHLPLSEMKKLFRNPKWDDRLEALMKEDSSTL